MSEPVRRSVEMSTRVAAAGVIGIVRSPSAATALQVSRVLLDAGMEVVEVSLVTPDALEVISALVADYPDAAVGAGTVLTAVQARACIGAGAALLVSPTTEPAVLATAERAGVLAIPGVNTPTECLTAVRLGAPLVKLFPASTWSPESLADLRSSLPALRLVPTGGVRIADAGAWYRAGAAALGIGGALTSGTPDECRERVGQLRAVMAQARGQG